MTWLKGFAQDYFLLVCLHYSDLYCGEFSLIQSIFCLSFLSIILLLSTVTIPAHDLWHKEDGVQYKKKKMNSIDRDKQNFCWTCVCKSEALPQLYTVLNAPCKVAGHWYQGDTSLHEHSWCDGRDRQERSSGPLSLSSIKLSGKSYPNTCCHDGFTGVKMLF